MAISIGSFESVSLQTFLSLLTACSSKSDSTANLFVEVMTDLKILPFSFSFASNHVQFTLAFSLRQNFLLISFLVSISSHLQTTTNYWTT